MGASAWHLGQGALMLLRCRLSAKKARREGSLIAFADTIRSVNAVLNPAQNIEGVLKLSDPAAFGRS